MAHVFNHSNDRPPFLHSGWTYLLSEGVLPGPQHSGHCPADQSYSGRAATVQFVEISSLQQGDAHSAEVAGADREFPGRERIGNGVRPVSDGQGGPKRVFHWESIDKRGILNARKLAHPFEQLPVKID